MASPYRVSIRTGLVMGLVLASRERSLHFFGFDQAYLDLLRAGDEQTTKHFVAYFTDLIRIKLTSRLRSNEAIEDVRQETFARVFKILRSENGIREAACLGSFVNSVCNHVLQEQYRTRSRYAQPIEEGAEDILVNDAPSPLDIVEATETQRAVRKVLSQLPERDRRLLQSIILEEQDKDQICAELGVTRGYLRVLLLRAKQAFRTSYFDGAEAKRVNRSNTNCKARTAAYSQASHETRGGRSNGSC